MTAATTPEPAPDMTPRNFVYCGRRWQGGEMCAALRLVAEDRIALDPEEQLFPLDKRLARAAIGGEYTGASFTAGAARVRGLNFVSYVRRWPDDAELVDWQARDDAADLAQRRAKQEEASRKRDEIAAVLLPLRKRYQIARSRHDTATMRALVEAVQLAVTKPLSKEEAGR